MTLLNAQMRLQIFFCQVVVSDVWCSISKRAQIQFILCYTTGNQQLRHF